MFLYSTSSLKCLFHNASPLGSGHLKPMESSSRIRSAVICDGLPSSSRLFSLRCYTLLHNAHARWYQDDENNETWIIMTHCNDVWQRKNNLYTLEHPTRTLLTQIPSSGCFCGTSQHPSCSAAYSRSCSNFWFHRSALTLTFPGHFLAAAAAAAGWEEWMSRIVDRRRLHHHRIRVYIVSLPRRHTYTGNSNSNSKWQW